MPCASVVSSSARHLEQLAGQLLAEQVVLEEPEEERVLAPGPVARTAGPSPAPASVPRAWRPPPAPRRRRWRPALRSPSGPAPRRWRAGWRTRPRPRWPAHGRTPPGPPGRAPRRRAGEALPRCRPRRATGGERRLLSRHAPGTLRQLQHLHRPLPAGEVLVRRRRLRDSSAWRWVSKSSGSTWCAWRAGAELQPQERARGVAGHSLVVALRELPDQLGVRIGQVQRAR